MTDRENIINHFRDAIEASGNNNKWRFVRVDVIEDAIKLLKEHEAVKPIFIQTTRVHEGGLMEVSIKCGNCKSKVQYYPERWKYCPNCGRRVKWE